MKHRMIIIFSIAIALVIAIITVKMVPGYFI